MLTKPVVAIAMSGGVDSSVAAALLVEKGYQVIGIMLRLWSEQGKEAANRCCTPDSMALARQVAASLSFPFYVLDAKHNFLESVVKPFIADYANNFTPNPCINCNRIIRWDFLFNYALLAGADYLATGHYARISQDQSGNYHLSRAIDSAKDQSYVLHILNQEKLKHALFPLGEFTKPQVRLLAQKYDLPVATRPDSQDLCFIGEDGDYRRFLLRHAPHLYNPGNILDHQGKILGEHEGLAFFTIGQRKGLHITSPAPMYVIEKDMINNNLIVGTIEQLGRRKLTATQVNWIAGHPPLSKFSAQIKIRYKAQFIPGIVSIVNEDSIRIEFEGLVRDIAPGQAAVIYNGDVCLGGGIISSSE